MRFLRSVGNKTLQENVHIKSGYHDNIGIVSGFYFIPELMKTNKVLAFLSVSEIENKSGSNSTKVSVTTFQFTIVGLINIEFSSLMTCFRISMRTCVHYTNITKRKSKMDLANTAELVRYAVENNLIDSNAAAAK